MALAKDYASVMGRSNDIQKDALGLDYAEFETSPIPQNNVKNQQKLWRL